MSLLSGIDLEGAAAEVAAHAPNVRAIKPTYVEPIRVRFDGAHGSAVAAS